MLRSCVAVAICALAMPLGAVGQSPSAPVPPQVQRGLDEARAHSSAGRHTEALATLDEAQAVADTSGSVEGQARIAVQRAVALRALNRPREAERVLLHAHALSRDTAFVSVAVQALNLLATLAADSGDVAQAAAWLREARPLAERASDRAVYASLLESIARTARSQGQVDDAIEAATEAIAIAEAEEDYLVVARALGTRSTTLLGLGRMDDALADAEAAYALALAHEPRIRSATLFALAQAHAHVWNLDRAADLWTKAIESYRQDNLPIGVALATRQRVDTWAALGAWDLAAKDGEEALRLMARAGSAGAEAGLLARLALVATQRDRPDEAVAYAARARAAAPEGPDRRFLDNDLGLVALRLGHLPEAETQFRAVLDTSTVLGDPEYLWRAHYGLGRVAAERRQWAAASRHLEQAVALVERMRRDLPEAGQRAAFLSDRAMAYEALATVRLRETSDDDAARAGRALEVAERARSRSLADLLAESRQRPTDPALQAVQAQERAFSERLAAWHKAILTAPDAAARADGERALAEAEREYESMVVRVRRDNPAYAGLTYPEPLSAEAMMAVPAPDEVVLAFMFDGDDEGVAWLVTRDGIRSYSIPGSRALESSVRLINSLVRSDDSDGLAALGTRLFAELVGPVQDRLAVAQRLVVIPAGPLHRLPFALLRPDNSRWLLDTHTISEAPSITVLAELRSRAAPAAADRLLAFAAGAGTSAGPGRLAHADAEVRRVARHLAAYATWWDGPRRTEADIKHSTGVYRVLHVATHAVIDERVPRRSAILLDDSDGEDGLLQLNEIPNLSLRAQLVVLAACQSQLGRRLNGEGLQSLSRAFMRAGSQAVLATLWDVDDALTRRFMEHFYARLRSGAAVDDALRTAQRRMIAEGGAAARPEVWAAFVLSGDAAITLPLDTPWWPAVLAGLCGLWLAGARIYRRTRATARETATTA